MYDMCGTQVKDLDVLQSLIYETDYFITLYEPYNGTMVLETRDLVGHNVGMCTLGNCPESGKRHADVKILGNLYKIKDSLPDYVFKTFNAWVKGGNPHDKGMDLEVVASSKDWINRIYGNETT